MILLVDDRPENLLPLKKILDLNDLDSESVLSGEEALKRILKNEYSLIIMDVQMPGMDGFEVAETISGYSKSRDIPIIFLSAVNKEKKFVTKGYNSGGIDYLTKPVDPEILILKVRTFLKLSEQQKHLKRMQTKLQNEVQERKAAQEELSRLNDSLEEKVRERTKELLSKNSELELLNLELQQFAWVVAHDLKEPVRKIQTFINLLGERFLSENSDALNYVNRSVQAARRMQQLIDDLLHYSRLSVDKLFEKADLGEIFSQVRNDLSDLIQEKDARIHCGPLTGIEVVPGQIRQVFHNLLSNSLKFSAEGVRPEIRVECRKVSELDPESEQRDDGDFLRISFSDNGIGFNPQFLDRIFVIFQRLHSEKNYEGTGIGLAIVKKIVDNHNGVISAYSEENKGSTFVIVLPVNQTKKLTHA